jgi:hypothetical protein
MLLPCPAMCGGCIFVDESSRVNLDVPPILGGVAGKAVDGFEGGVAVLLWVTRRSMANT